MEQKKRNPRKKISRRDYSIKEFENQIYSKEEIEQNELIEKAIHENHKKKIKKINILDFMFYFLSLLTFFLGLIFFIAVIKNLRF